MDEVLARNSKFDRKLILPCQKFFDQTPFSFLTYFTITHRGHYTGYTTDIEWFEHFIDQRLFFSEMMRSPRFYQSGISILSEENHSQKDLANEFALTRQYFHPLYMLKVTPEGFEGYCLCSDQKGFSTLEYYINHLDRIKKFISEYHEATADVRHHFLFNMIDFKSLVGSSFETQPPYIRGVTPEKIQHVNPVDLTPAELDCLRFFLAGKTAGEIARHLHRSQRTVETHLTNIKNKWLCSKKSEIFDKAHHYGLATTSIQCLF
ncbi:MAG: helix-turn-helix transcriptional regulator [Chlamydiia bacterium]|nr:helix-turn-helix transcriptional regulator [Chlamydiia bacterium]